MPLDEGRPRETKVLQCFRIRGGMVELGSAECHAKAQKPASGKIHQDPMPKINVASSRRRGALHCVETYRVSPGSSDAIGTVANTGSAVFVWLAKLWRAASQYLARSC